MRPASAGSPHVVYDFQRLRNERLWYALVRGKLLMACGTGAARAKKAALVFPRPTSALRPVVRGQTVKYNLKQKLGRGFTFEELKVCLSTVILQVSMRVLPAVHPSVATGTMQLRRKQPHGTEYTRLACTAASRPQQVLRIPRHNMGEPWPRSLSRDISRRCVEIYMQ